MLAQEREISGKWTVIPAVSKREPTPVLRGARMAVAVPPAQPVEVVTGNKRVFPVFQDRVGGSARYYVVEGEKREEGEEGSGEVWRWQDGRWRLLSLEEGAEEAPTPLSAVGVNGLLHTVAGGAVWVLRDSGSAYAWQSVQVDGDAAPAARRRATLCGAGGSLYVLGGEDGQGAAVSELWQLEAGTGRWRQLSEGAGLGGGFEGGALVAEEEDGEVEALYAVNAGDGAVWRLELGEGEAAERQWRQLEVQGDAPSACVCVGMGRGRVLALSAVGEVWLLDVDGRRWRALPCNGSAPATIVSAARVSAERVLVVCNGQEPMVLRILW